MSNNVSWNGSTYAVPTTGEENWGGTTKVDGLLIALATHGFQKTGGLFTLSADSDFGTSFGLKAVYFKSRGTVATAGVIRLAKTESVAWLNNAGSGNNTLVTDTGDQLLYNGVAIASSAGVVPVAAGGTGLTAYTTGDLLYASGSTTLAKLGIGTSNKVLTSTGSAPAWNTIVNANIDAAAAVAYSKLALTGSVVNADINASAAIAYSKLALTGSVVNADLSASAAVAFSKLASLTSAHILVGSAGNVATDVAVTGDVTISNAGVTAIGANKVLVSMIGSGVASSGQVPTADGSGNTAWGTPTAAPTQSYELNNLGLSAAASGNALTISLTQGDGSTAPAAGSGAVKVSFRSATATTGGYSERSVVAANAGVTTVVIPSGTTIGTLNNTLAYLWVYLMDNSGTPTMAVSLTRFDEGTVQSSTAISAGASATTLYSTSGLASKAIRLIGRITVTAATAGTWASQPTEVSIVPFRNCFAPTIQRFTATGTVTYTPTAGTIYSIVEMCGAGAGGGASQSNSGGNTNGDTVFGGSTAGKGTGGAPNSGDGGNGGTNTFGSGHTTIIDMPGGKGAGGQSRGALTEVLNGGVGGQNVFGGAGVPSSTNAGTAGAANSGAGGGGGSASNLNSGGGGGAGGYMKFLVKNPIAVSTTVGTGGGGGSAGNAAGGDGGSGVIIVYDYTG